VTGASERDGDVAVKRDLAVLMLGGARQRGHLRRPIDSPSRLIGLLLGGGWWP
jgi:hypothetical protein